MGAGALLFLVLAFVGCFIEDPTFTWRERAGTGSMLFSFALLCLVCTYLILTMYRWNDQVIEKRMSIIGSASPLRESVREKVRRIREKRVAAALNAEEFRFYKVVLGLKIRSIVLKGTKLSGTRKGRKIEVELTELKTVEVIPRHHQAEYLGEAIVLADYHGHRLSIEPPVGDFDVLMEIVGRYGKKALWVDFSKGKPADRAARTVYLESKLERMRGGSVAFGLIPMALLCYMAYKIDLRKIPYMMSYWKDIPVEIRRQLLVSGALVFVCFLLLLLFWLWWLRETSRLKKELKQIDKTGSPAPR
ncbi:hypothetical protein AMJ85_08515 [candidate division BRC1 bacterium SM23_51]|nr:MAG: hypothetical protein AMJ85_08515 [candidate division BRC1 bacterium SM23_51]